MAIHCVYQDCELENILLFYLSTFDGSRFLLHRYNVIKRRYLIQCTRRVSGITFNRYTPYRNIGPSMQDGSDILLEHILNTHDPRHINCFKVLLEPSMKISYHSDLSTCRLFYTKFLILCNFFVCYTTEKNESDNKLPQPQT